MSIQSAGRARSRHWLATGAKERAPLGLHDTLDFAFLAGVACFSFPSVDSMVELVAPLAVDSISVRTIREGGPLGDDGLSENFSHGVINPKPSASGNL